jgi:hypothetical protein
MALNYEYDMLTELKNLATDVRLVDIESVKSLAEDLGVREIKRKPAEKLKIAKT